MLLRPLAAKLIAIFRGGDAEPSLILLPSFLGGLRDLGGEGPPHVIVRRPFKAEMILLPPVVENPWAGPLAGSPNLTYVTAPRFWTRYFAKLMDGSI